MAAVCARPERARRPARWVNHYATFNTVGGNWGDITTYIAARVAYANGQIGGAIAGLGQNIFNKFGSAGGNPATGGYQSSLGTVNLGLKNIRNPFGAY